jgi:hypothetical protein
MAAATLFPWDRQGVNEFLSRHEGNKLLFTEEDDRENMGRTDNIDWLLLSRVAQPQDIVCISKNRPTTPSTAH